MKRVRLDEAGHLDETWGEAHGARAPRRGGAALEPVKKVLTTMRLACGIPNATLTTVIGLAPIVRDIRRPALGWRRRTHEGKKTSAPSAVTPRGAASSRRAPYIRSKGLRDSVIRKTVRSTRVTRARTRAKR
jgi:hypothetical protein